MFKIGDKVKVVRKVPSFHNGWTDTWIDVMDEYIGQETTVIANLGPFGLRLKPVGVSAYTFPPEALEFATTAKDKVIKKFKFEESGVEYVTPRIGARVRIIAEEYILACCDTYEVVAISLSSGNRYAAPVKVNNVNNLTESEIAAICGTVYEVI